MNVFNRMRYIYQEEEPGPEGGGGAGGGENKPDGGGSLLGDNSDLGDGEYYLTEGIKGSGDVPEWYQGTKYKTIAEQAKGYSELEKKFGSFTGTPKDGYQLGDGVEKDDALVNEMIEFATSINMNQDGFEKGLALLMAQGEAVGAADTEAEMEKLGPNAAARLTTIEGFLKNNLGEDYEKLRHAVNNADVVALVEKLIHATAPKKLPKDGGDNPEGLTWEAIEKEMFRKDDNGNMLRSISPEHEKKVQAMLVAWGGNAPSAKAIG